MRQNTSRDKKTWEMCLETVAARNIQRRSYRPSHCSSIDLRTSAADSTEDHRRPPTSDNHAAEHAGRVVFMHDKFTNHRRQSSKDLWALASVNDVLVRPRIARIRPSRRQYIGLRDLTHYASLPYDLAKFVKLQ